MQGKKFPVDFLLLTTFFFLEIKIVEIYLFNLYPALLCKWAQGRFQQRIKTICFP